MERVKRDNKRDEPSLNINIDWKQIIHKHFKTIVVAILFVLVLLLLVFIPDMADDIQTILIAVLGSFAGFIIGKEIN